MEHSCMYSILLFLAMCSLGAGIGSSMICSDPQTGNDITCTTPEQEQDLDLFKDELIAEMEQRISGMIDEQVQDTLEDTLEKAINKVKRKLMTLLQKMEKKIRQGVAKCIDDVMEQIKERTVDAPAESPEVEAEWGPWEPWSECPTCAPSRQIRVRECLQGGTVAKTVSPCMKQSSRLFDTEGRTCKGLPPCDPCRVRHAGKCYWLDFDDTLSYEDAQDVCEGQGSQLADIYDKTHYEAVYQMVKDQMPPDAGLMGLWTGMRMDYLTRNLTLSNGSPAGYEKWASSDGMMDGDPLPSETHSEYAHILLRVQRLEGGSFEKYEGFTTNGTHTNGVLCQRVIA